MELQQLDLLLRLMIAHFLADFIFQTDRIAREKKHGLSSGYFYLHIAIVGIVTYVMLGDWTNPSISIVVMLAHGIVDLGKSAIKRENALLYVVDQLLHILTLVIIWLVFTGDPARSVMSQTMAYFVSPKFLILVLAYLVNALPVGYLIGLMTGRWQRAIAGDNAESLKDAGKWIGVLERLLILTFVLVDQWAAIGFLLAAKSVFRFGDLRNSTDRMKTEYILIGTLLSFAFSIGLGIGVRLLL